MTFCFLGRGQGNRIVDPRSLRLFKIRTVYVYLRDEDYGRSEERSFVKICKRDGAFSSAAISSGLGFVRWEVVNCGGRIRCHLPHLYGDPKSRGDDPVSQLAVTEDFPSLSASWKERTSFGVTACSGRPARGERKFLISFSYR